VLDGFDTLKICTGYRLDGETLDYLPAGVGAQALAEAIYEEMDGWRETTHGARSWSALPVAAQAYVRRIESLIGAEVSVVTTSPERDDIIMLRDPFLG
jgi:adenylosuccinate synthase